MTSPYSERIDAAMADLGLPEEIPDLYDPIRYTLALAGKRLRPAMVLMAADLFRKGSKKALNAAVGIELFHNFTLIHDDVMDNAPLRRGQPTVVKKWDQNTAILSGDALYAIACQWVAKSEGPGLRTILDTFFQTAVHVCEGQRMDMAFEKAARVPMSHYLRMIEFKTARLIAGGMKIGAILGGATEKEASSLYKYGVLVGTAFQLMDDFLDTFGNEEKFGKQKGGDIMAGKKTFLYIYTLEHGDDRARAGLMEHYGAGAAGNRKNISAVETAFRSSKSDEALKTAVKDLMEESENLLSVLQLNEKNKKELIHLSRKLTTRET